MALINAISPSITSNSLSITPTSASSPSPPSTDDASYTSTTSTTPETISFLSLPLEIRLEIYKLLLILPSSSSKTSSKTSSKVSCKSPIPSRYETPTYVSSAILLANRQINFEATPLLYSSNIFIAHPSLLASFPRLRSYYPPLRESAVLPLIRRFHLQVRLDNDLNYNRCAAAKAFSGIHELSIELVQSEFLGVGYHNLTTFEDVRGVGRATILGSTTGFEDYVCWLQNAMMTEQGVEVPEFEASDNTMAHILNARLGSHS